MIRDRDFDGRMKGYKKHELGKSGSWGSSGRESGTSGVPPMADFLKDYGASANSNGYVSEAVKAISKKQAAIDKKEQENEVIRRKNDRKATPESIVKTGFLTGDPQKNRAAFTLWYGKPGNFDKSWQDFLDYLETVRDKRSKQKTIRGAIAALGVAASVVAGAVFGPGVVNGNGPDNNRPAPVEEKVKAQEPVSTAYIKLGGGVMTPEPPRVAPTPKPTDIPPTPSIIDNDLTRFNPAVFLFAQRYMTLKYTPYGDVIVHKPLFLSSLDRMDKNSEGYKYEKAVFDIFRSGYLGEDGSDKYKEQKAQYEAFLKGIYQLRAPPNYKDNFYVPMLVFPEQGATCSLTNIASVVSHLSGRGIHPAALADLLQPMDLALSSDEKEKNRRVAGIDGANTFRTIETTLLLEFGVAMDTIKYGDPDKDGNPGFLSGMPAYEKLKLKETWEKWKATGSFGTDKAEVKEVGVAMVNKYLELLKDGRIPIIGADIGTWGHAMTVVGAGNDNNGPYILVFESNGGTFWGGEGWAWTEKWDRTWIGKYPGLVRIDLSSPLHVGQIIKHSEFNSYFKFSDSQSAKDKRLLTKYGGAWARASGVLFDDLDRIKGENANAIRQVWGINGRLLYDVNRYGVKEK